PQEVKFVQVSDAGALDDFFARSHERPVLVFKHSLTCPISSAAYEEMSRLSPAVVPELALVVVQRARDISAQVATRTGVRHESPQAVVLHKGTVVWSASHFDVTADAVEQAFKAVNAQ
ncbi:MAG: bacillithiol system redox-active protein YtxJ, partial [Pyrinomonadaceae bacterium]